MSYTYYTVSCGACRRVFSTRDHRQRTCSKRCAQLSRFPDRAMLFWSKVTKTDTCWLWTGSLNPKGYGIIRINNKPIKTHRLSYEQSHGTIPPGLFVCHRCDVRNCVNPDHLFLGTITDNTLDMFSKGRNAIGVKGSRPSNARLTNEDVRAIRQSLEPLKIAATRYGTSLSCISAIRHRKNWKHVA